MTIATADGAGADPQAGPGGDDRPRVLIVAEHASARFGGEAILPLHYFRFLRRRGVEAWLLVHDRTRAELASVLAGDFDRVHFVADTALHRLLHRAGGRLPAKVAYFTLGLLSRRATQGTAKGIAKALVRGLRVDVVHQPIPVSPKEPSSLHGLGVPVVIGPMNGGMSYPRAFAAREGALTIAAIALGRLASRLLNRIIPGKRRAAVLLVANERTRLALPPGARGEVVGLVENGVDLALWSAPERPEGRPCSPVRFAFFGRLVDWKAVDLLLDAFRAVLDAGVPAHLEIIGDGPMRASLEAQAERTGLSGSVRFAGWVAQADCPRRLREADVLVLPSLFECGGAVVLEAMACGLPVVATAWGGPADYLDESCGVLVEPSSRGALVSGFAGAMIRLAGDPGLRESMGKAGRGRVVEAYDWERKIDRILEVYREAIARPGVTGVRPASRR